MTNRKAIPEPAAPTRVQARRTLLSRLAALAGALAPLTLLPGGRAAAKEIAQPRNAGPQAFMKRAQKMKNLALATGDQGYGAVIVKAGRIVAQTPSRVVVDRDPTAHAEMEAIRAAARLLGTRDLSGCVLYGTSRACQMCETAAHWANLETMVYGPSLTEAGRPQYRRC
jgi:tRNA(Arg) A34 adenosine deaminase TadA